MWKTRLHLAIVGHMMKSFSFRSPAKSSNIKLNYPCLYIPHTIMKTKRKSPFKDASRWWTDKKKKLGQACNARKVMISHTPITNPTHTFTSFTHPFARVYWKKPKTSSIQIKNPKKMKPPNPHIPISCFKATVTELWKLDNIFNVCTLTLNISGESWSGWFTVWSNLLAFFFPKHKAKPPTMPIKAAKYVIEFTWKTQNHES